MRITQPFLATAQMLIGCFLYTFRLLLKKKYVLVEVPQYLNPSLFSFTKLNFLCDLEREPLTSYNTIFAVVQRKLLQ